MDLNITLELAPLPPDRMLAFHRTIASADIDGVKWEVTTAEAGAPALAFLRDGKVTQAHTLALVPLIEAALAALTGLPNS